jgi:deazaflavin-dependent oxidoreductase (nitroreductase family)
MPSSPSSRIAPPRWIKPFNRVLLGIRKVGGLHELPVLTVVGRRSGKPRRTPLTVVTLDGERYLLEGFPGADWAHNVRAAGGSATLAIGSTTESVHLTELDAGQAIPVLREWPAQAGTDGPKIMKSVGVIDEISPDAFAALAGRCAVFRVDPV